MAIREVVHLQISCDYIDHGVNRELSKGAWFHKIDSNIIICSDCWDNKLIVEKLLRALGKSHIIQSLDQLNCVHEKLDRT